MRFDTIVVPRGAEARAVERGWAQPRPAIVEVPAGTAAGKHLDTVPLAGTVLVLGVCGAIDPRLQVGDSVVYARIAGDAETIELDPQLAAACAAACTSPLVNALGVAVIIGDVAAKSALRTANRAAVVDMEAASIVRSLHRRGVRVAMVRVVSDDAEHDLPELRNVYDADGRLRPIALAAALLRTPRRSVRFIGNALRALHALQATATRIAISSTDESTASR